MKETEPEIIAKFYESQSIEYREALNELVMKLVGKYNMNLLTSGVIFHKEYQQRESKKRAPWKHK